MAVKWFCHVKETKLILLKFGTLIFIQTIFFTCRVWLILLIFEKSSKRWRRKYATAFGRSLFWMVQYKVGIIYNKFKKMYTTQLMTKKKISSGLRKLNRYLKTCITRFSFNLFFYNVLRTKVVKTDFQNVYTLYRKWFLWFCKSF